MLDLGPYLTAIASLLDRSRRQLGFASTPTPEQFGTGPRGRAVHRRRADLRRRCAPARVRRWRRYDGRVARPVRAA
jgi:hypothetical protein